MRQGFLLICTLLLCACGGQVQQTNSELPDTIPDQLDSVAVAENEISESVDPKPNQATGEQSVPSVSTPAVQEKSFIVVSKLHENLSVYDVRNNDTVILVQYPACMGKNMGNKEKKGDMKTPESPKGKPFFISQIQDASTWHHDFGDGRGSIKAYGHWFLRLNTPGHSGIGIHGSTNNESTVPGRASEGCIRLRDADIIDLKEKYAYVGMPVIVKAEGEE